MLYLCEKPKRPTCRQVYRYYTSNDGDFQGTELANIGRNWNGRVFGTNTGNVSLTLEGEDNALKGLIRLADDQAGLIVYEVSGTYDAGSLTLTGSVQGDIPDGLIVGELTVTGALTPESAIDGEWSTTIGTGGTFRLWPHNYAVRAPSSDIPEQLNTSTCTLGAMRLYADDVRSIIGYLVRDFSQKRAIVTYNDHGNEKNVFAEDFEAVLDTLPELRYLKITITEPELYGLNRNAMIELTAWGENTIRVQSVQEAWAIGKSEALSRHVGKFQRKIATQFRKFGLSANVVILVAALAALPGLPTFFQRLLFAGSAFGVQLLIAYLHRRYVPNFILYPAEAQSNWFGRSLPAVISWGLTIVGGLASTVAYGLLKGELNGTPFANVFPFLFN